MVQGIDNRTHGRRRTIFGGVLFTQDGGSWECAIVDISETGAKVRSDAGVAIGDKVDLKINKLNDFRTCEVVWLREGAVGLQFLVRLDPKRTDMQGLLGILRK
ncbi:MAG: PilZ domain-containing protein [Rhodospirillales bacterium]